MASSWTLADHSPVRSIAGAGGAAWPNACVLVNADAASSQAQAILGSRVLSMTPHFIHPRLVCEPRRLYIDATCGTIRARWRRERYVERSAVGLAVCFGSFHAVESGGAARRGCPGQARRALRIRAASRH